MVQKTGSSDSKTGFDFSTPNAIMGLLKALRNYPSLDIDTRNELRDLIFAYSSNGGGEAAQADITARLLVAGITPTLVLLPPVGKVNSAKKSTPEVLKPGFSRGRLSPEFSISVVNQTNKTVLPSASFLPKKPAELSPSVKSITNQTSVEASRVTPLESAKTRISPIFVNRNKDIAQLSRAGRDDKVSSELSQDQLKAPTPETTLAPTKEEKSDPTTIKPASVATTKTIDPSVLLERIKIIKADINARIGSSVNLVSIDNAIGREYMSALLEAMKQLGIGNQITITKTLDRLEQAYQQALLAIELNQEVKNQPEPIIPAEVTPNRLRVEPTLTAESVSVPTIPIPIKTITPTPVTPVITGASNQTIPATSPTVTNNPPLGITYKNSQRNPSLASALVATPTPTPTPISPIISASVQSKPVVVAATKPTVSAPATVITPDSSEAPVPVPIQSSKLTPLSAVADATPLRRIDELPTLSEVQNRSESGNPLYTQEVSNGLGQLLSEWKLFRRSGLLGTGPHGIDHPLFQHIRSLQIPFILSGRFAGATDEARQSISDYMNGWRYEYGIIYQKDETFEQYLRRVIRHILDLQDS